MRARASRARSSASRRRSRARATLRPPRAGPGRGPGRLGPPPRGTRPARSARSSELIRCDRLLMLDARLLLVRLLGAQLRVQLAEARVGARGHGHRGTVRVRPPPWPRRRPAVEESCAFRSSYSLPTGLAVGLARRLRYTVIRPRFAPGNVGPPLSRSNWREIRRRAPYQELRRGPAYARAAVASRSRRGRSSTRVRAIPVGFVRTYGDVSPGAPARGRRRAARLRRPVGALAPDRPRRRLAGQGRAPARAARAEGVPFRGSRVDHAGRAAPARRDVGPARDRARPPPARVPPGDARGRSARCPSWARSTSGCCTC